MSQQKNNKTKNEEKQNLLKAQELIDKIELNLDQLKNILFDDLHKSVAKTYSKGKSSSQNIIEGIFNGFQMVDSDGKKYSVPENYASKSKLVEGDVLKLTISQDGTYIFKQIGPIERKKIIGALSQNSDKFFVKTENKKYRVLNASISYFKANPGDKLTILVPKNKESQWAAVENVI